MEDLYRILGVNPDATEKEIHRAYIRLIKHYHPDNKGDAEKAAKINHAHDVLMNPESRKEYDDKCGYYRNKTQEQTSYRSSESSDSNDSFYTTYKEYQESYDRFRQYQEEYCRKKDEAWARQKEEWRREYEAKEKSTKGFKSWKKYDKEPQKSTEDLWKKAYDILSWICAIILVMCAMGNMK